MMRALLCGLRQAQAERVFGMPHSPTPLVLSLSKHMGATEAAQ